MLTQKSVHTYGFISIGVMAVLLALIWLHLVPPSLFRVFFGVAALLSLAWFVLRILLARAERREDPPEVPGNQEK